MQSLAVLIAAASLVTTGPAPRPTSPPRLPQSAAEASSAPADSSIRRQLDRIDKTIRQARKSGTLTRQEAKTLRRESARLRRYAYAGPATLARAQLENQMFMLRDAVNIRSRASEPRVVAVN